ncbi:hypothetical protein QR680_009342 [Steinernema hermaphroditum]|uniref:Amiloride-sensitive sodium channel n=1 Tax=Steinernema hermaphroditum TaxID=289476 RepID=A0AA39IJX7_9BILA|nr:hypothetical protein QR680_009342 [Steinernema hermaphroditum]
MPKTRPSLPAIVVNEDATPRVTEDPPGEPSPDSKQHLAAAQMCGSRGSFSEEARRLTMKASELVIHLPVEQIRRIGETESMNSISRETEHFVGITTVHGPLRIYRGKGYYSYLWAVALGCCVGLFLYQFTSLFQNFISRPTVSQVSFILPEEGLPFPAVTICNYNPVRRSYVEALNNTTEFNEVLLDYLVQAYADVQSLVEGASFAQLQEGEAALQRYILLQPNFTINSFFKDAGFACEDMFKLCSFGGKRFPCCDYAKPTLTDMGKCFRLDLGNSQKEWMRMQTQPGVANGLQIVADFHKEEEIGTGAAHGLEPLFMNEFENGFRYFVHSRETIPYLATEGISVSPGSRVYSALSPQRFVLLDETSWGNCTDQWPPGYRTPVPYSATNCKALCRARFFDERCGCAPFTFNVGGRYKVCTPYQIFRCVQNLVETDPEASDGFTKLRLPACTECKVECESWLFHAFNSYGQGFSVGALKWFERRDENWTAPHVKANFVAINIFFRDMSFTQYTQVQGVSLTETFSDIGGNMGMFMGMSLLSIIEVVIWLSKISWVAISKRRRQYLVAKKSKEKERQQRLEETLQEPRSGTDTSDASPNGSTRERLRRLAGSLRQRSRLRKSFDDDYADGPQPRPSPPTPLSPRSFVDALLENNLHGAGRAASGRKTTPTEQMLELKIDLEQLARLQRDPSRLQEGLANTLVAAPQIVSVRNGAPTPEQLVAAGRRRSTSIAYLNPAPSKGTPRGRRRRSYSTSSAYANPAFETIPEVRETPLPSRRGSAEGTAIAALMDMSAPMLLLPQKAPEELVPPRRGSLPLQEFPFVSLMVDEVADEAASCSDFLSPDNRVGTPLEREDAGRASREPPYSSTRDHFLSEPDPAPGPATKSHEETRPMGLKRNSSGLLSSPNGGPTATVPGIESRGPWSADDIFYRDVC